jgi:hypothetical protein
MRVNALLITAILLVSGCSAALPSKPAEVGSLSQGHGIVIGSVVLKTRKESSAFSYSLSGKSWYASLRPSSEGSFVSKLFPPAGWSLGVAPDGKEVPFVAVLPVGKYQLENLHSTGVDPNFIIHVRLKFTVEEKKKKYLGRLVVEIPDHVGMFQGIFTKAKPFAFSVEDAQQETIGLLSGEYGTSIADGLQKELLTVPTRTTDVPR